MRKMEIDAGSVAGGRQVGGLAIGLGSALGVRAALVVQGPAAEGHGGAAEGRVFRLVRRKPTDKRLSNASMYVCMYILIGTLLIEYGLRARGARYLSDERVPVGLRQALELELVHSIQRLHIGGAQQLGGNLTQQMMGEVTT